MINLQCTCSEPQQPTAVEVRMAEIMGVEPEFVHAMMDLFENVVAEVGIE